MEARRREPRETGDPIRRGWYLGTKEFKKELQARMEGRLGANHAGQLRREAAEAIAQRMIDRELKRRGWTQGELKDRTKTDPAKVALAAQIRRETTVPIRWLATRLHMGTRQTLNAALYLWRKEHEQATSTV